MAKKPGMNLRNERAVAATRDRLMRRLARICKSASLAPKGHFGLYVLTVDGHAMSVQIHNGMLELIQPCISDRRHPLPKHRGLRSYIALVATIHASCTRAEAIAKRDAQFSAVLADLGLTPEQVLLNSSWSDPAKHVARLSFARDFTPAELRELLGWMVERGLLRSARPAVTAVRASPPKPKYVAVRAAQPKTPGTSERK